MSRFEGELFLADVARADPSRRDRVAEEWLGLDSGQPTDPPGDELVGYHPSGIGSIVRMLLEVPVHPRDVFVDLGSGLGKVVFVTRLLTQAHVRGIELQPALVERARLAGARLALDVDFVHADARTSAASTFDDGTVFFLYLPFTGSALDQVLSRLHAVATGRTIVVCTLGIDLDRAAPWLVRRATDSFWLAICDSAVPGAPARGRADSIAWPDAAIAIAFERFSTERP
jgi:SAM-dependent methyltransferase